MRPIGLPVYETLDETTIALSCLIIVAVPLAVLAISNGFLISNDAISLTILPSPSTGPPGCPAAEGARDDFGLGTASSLIHGRLSPSRR